MDLVAPALPAEFVLRPICPTDQSALADFYTGLSPRSRSARFHGPGTLSAADLAAMAGADGARSAGWVAWAGSLIVGHLLLVPGGPPGVYELGIAVADAFQGHGIASALLGLGLAWARTVGPCRLVAPVRWGNLPMERLLARHAVARSSVGGTATFLIELPPGPKGPASGSEQA